MSKSDSIQLSSSLEDYLEAIYRIVQDKQAALPKDIRKFIRVGRSSVTGALKMLVERDLINHDPYGVITLTDRGTAVAEEIVRRHETLKHFFVNVLAVDEDEADANACGMEHAISEVVLERFVEFAEFVERCPRAGAKWVRGFGYFCDNDKKTGNCEKCVELVLDEVRGKDMKSETTAAECMSLAEVKPGSRMAIERIEGSGGIRRRLLDMGVTKGSIVAVEKVAPLGDPMEVKIKGYHLTLRKEEASRVIVCPVSN